jgi:Trk K+ transport system NAD-binding subunit
VPAEKWAEAKRTEADVVTVVMGRADAQLVASLLAPKLYNNIYKYNNYNNNNNNKEEEEEDHSEAVKAEEAEWEEISYKMDKQ